MDTQSAASLPSGQDSWVCPGCQAVNTTNFCPHCGASRPQPVAAAEMSQPEPEIERSQQPVPAPVPPAAPAPELQGCCQQSLETWLCPECENQATGPVCPVCGTPQPVPVPEPEKAPEPVPQDAGQGSFSPDLQGSFSPDLQGSYQQSLESWLCPVCENQTTGPVCTVCSAPRPTKKTSGGSGKHHRNSMPPRKTNPRRNVLLLALLALVVAAAGIFWFTPLGHTLLPQDPADLQLSDEEILALAQSQIDQGQYEQASRLLSQLSPDSLCLPQAKQLVLSRSSVCRESGQYDDALLLLQALPSDPVIVNRIQSVYTRQAEQWLKEGQYAQAYERVSQLESSTARSLTREIVAAWVSHALDTGDVEVARHIAQDVTMTRSLSTKVYTMLYSAPIYQYDSSTDSYLYQDGDMQVRLILLEHIPSLAIPEKTALETLFQELEKDPLLPYQVVKDHPDLLKRLWNMPVVQNIVEHDDCINQWLVGRWTTDDGQYHFEFEDTPDGYNITYNLPYVYVPGDDYYTITDLTMSLVDEDKDVSKPSFRFRLVGPDRIEIFAYNNNRKYRMTREGS